MKKQIKVIVVEDHPIYREAVELSLLEESDISLVNQFGSAEAALSALKDKTAKYVDVVLLDLNLPGINGLEALPQFKQAIPGIHIIVLTQSDQKESVLKAIQSGASGYLLKSAPIESITQGIRTVMEGGASLDSEVARLILDEMQMPQPKNSSEAALTPRETDILILLSEGFVKKEIADKLSISHHTVVEHIKRIYVKLEVQNAPAAVSKAYKRGIFPSK